MNWKAGDKARWLYTTNRGWGGSAYVSVEIVKVGSKRIQVKAPLRYGGVKLVWVKPDKLSELVSK